MRVTYWTTAPLEPEIEAVSKEVFELAGHFPGSRIFGVSQHMFTRFDWRRRAVGFHPDFNPLLRGLIPAVEYFTDINHVYGEISPWVFSRTLGRRPMILTIASEKGNPLPEFLDRCDEIVVQTHRMMHRLTSFANKVRLIYPGIHLERFKPRPFRGVDRRPRILLATFPRSHVELDSRGVSFLLDVAEYNSDLEFTFVSRPWRSGATALSVVRQRLGERNLRNVRVLEGVQPDMGRLYADHEFTVIPYTTADGGKECPRSLTESLACGVPVLISEAATLAPFVEERACGRVFQLSAASFTAAIEAALADYRRLARNAVETARACFDLRSTLTAYREVYERLPS